MLNRQWRKFLWISNCTDVPVPKNFLMIRIRQTYPRYNILENIMIPRWYLILIAVYDSKYQRRNWISNELRIWKSNMFITNKPKSWKGDMFVTNKTKSRRFVLFWKALVHEDHASTVKRREFKMNLILNHHMLEHKMRCVFGLGM